MAGATPQVVIVGALGRMGREIGKVVAGEPGVALAGCVEAPGNPGVGRKYGVLIGEEVGDVLVSADLETLPLDKPGTVIINFASPQAADELIDTCRMHRAAVVLGTTGLTDATREKLTALARSVPVVSSPNMSLGVNLLFHLTAVAAAKLAATFDIEIVEAHHRNKHDSPSGTARRLGEIAAQALGKQYSECVKNGREGLVGERAAGEIGMHAVRGGDIVGDHTVMFAGDGERIELRHMAHSRATFARGAVTAARWVVGRRPGLYSMRDVLGLS